MSSNKKYWKNVEELNDDSSIVQQLRSNEFAEDIPTDEFLGDEETMSKSSTSRRDFLKYVGFSTAAATLAACEGPVIKTVPYVVQPERIIPGIADFYATTLADGFDFASVLVKTRESRPIKVDKNYFAKTNMSVNARVQASVLSLYDNERVKRPQIKGKNVSWETFDKEVQAKLTEVKGETVILSQTFASPSTARAIKEFAAKQGNVRHVVYDAVSEDGMLNAFQAKYGKRALPNYDFSSAEVIVSVGADILSDWQGGGHDNSYVKSRNPEGGKMSRHIQFESNTTRTGAKADKRVPVTPSEQKQILAALYNHIVKGASSNNLSAKLKKAVEKTADYLQKAGSSAILVTGISSTEAQTLALAINEALNSNIINTKEPRLIRQGNAAEVQQLVKDMNAGKVGAILIAGVNPAYSLPNTDAFKKGIKKVGLTVDFSMKADETALLCEYVAATPHYLESWGDVQFTTKNYSLVQPTIRPLFDTRQFQDTLLKWSGNKSSYYEFVQATWNNSLGSLTWNQALHDGVFTANAPKDAEGIVDATTKTKNAGISADTAARTLANAKKAQAGQFEMVLYTKEALGDGQQANNPWLQEFPDPMTRTTWDNYITMSVDDAAALEIENPVVSNGAINGNYVQITLGDKTVKKVPVMILPGQARGTLGFSLGYGKKEGIQKEMQVGVNAYPLYKDFQNTQIVSIAKVEGEHEFACTQLQATLAGRSEIIIETSLDEYVKEDREVWNPVSTVSYDHSPVSVTNDKADIWTMFDREIGHHFNLSIDLNSCTGCGACVIACNAENNIPVVGKEQVRKFRDMHWLRIDRYFSSEETFQEDFGALEKLDLFETYKGVETPHENPQVAFQPIMCQHCNHAPCETVCPVAATSHGRQGQNQMIYNRCVGTRYCANNCPYKVRRFNWFNWSENDEFNYNMNSDLGRMVLNPDVVVRSRGVMEKCSMCIQLTQQTILNAKREGRAIKDGEFYTACSRACDTGAMVFGDINIEDSEILKKKNNDRMYHLLASTGTQPNVMYQVKVNNTTEL